MTRVCAKLAERSPFVILGLVGWTCLVLALVTLAYRIFCDLIMRYVRVPGVVIRWVFYFSCPALAVFWFVEGGIRNVVTTIEEFLDVVDELSGGDA